MRPTVAERWLSAHLFYEGDLDDLLVRAAGPLVSELASGGLITGSFFLRYWEGGSHLRLRVLPVDPSTRNRVQTLITERIGRYLREHPSADVMSAAEYARLAKTMASAEGLTGYTRCMCPNNSIAFIPYRREHDRYGYGQSIEAVERHFTESSRIALSLLGAGMSRSERATACYCLIALTWSCGGPSPPRSAGGTGPYPSWERRFHLGELIDGAGLDAHYRRQRDRVVHLTRRLQTLAGRLPDVAGDQALAAWGKSVVSLRDALGDPSARVLPVLDVCAHLACNRLGVSLVEECSLRYLASRALAAIAGEER